MIKTTASNLFTTFLYALYSVIEWAFFESAKSTPVIYSPTPFKPQEGELLKVQVTNIVTGNPNTVYVRMALPDGCNYRLRYRYKTKNYIKLYRDGEVKELRIRGSVHGLFSKEELEAAIAIDLQKIIQHASE